MDQFNSSNLSFNIDLEPTGDENSFFRYRNSPGEVHRPIIVDRHTSVKSELSIQGGLDTVIHGKFAPNGPQATLIVARFQFLGSQPSRRFCSANISIRFRDKDDSTRCVVHKIAPSGQYCLNPSFNQQEVKVGVGANAGVGAAIASAGLQATYELTRSLERQDSGSLYGVSKTEGRNYGPRNAAKWSMSQNDAQKNGIPSTLRVAILLRRDNDHPFFAEIKVNAQVDIFYKLECRMHNLAGSDKIDPIMFDPKRTYDSGITPEGLDTNSLSSYSLEHLGGIDVTQKIHMF